MSEIKVNSIKGVGASTAAITVDNSSGSATANLTTVNSVTMPNGGFLSNRNIIINGACNVAQRSLSSTSSGYQTVDRFKTNYSGLDNNPTQAQVDVASGTTPYTQGFRKAIKITNGNQSSGAGAGDQASISYIIEDQDLATSGWNYLSATSYVTLSFWFKSSVNQTFYVVLESKDGSSKQYSFAVTPTGADTWTKVTHSIKGDSGLQFSNDNGEGIEIYFLLFYGTNATTSGHTLNTWKATSASDQAPDMTSTWYTTNNATWEMTAVQLEVGSVATDFEHRSFGQELSLCQRYYYKTYDYATAPATATFVGMQHGRNFSSSARSSVPICLNFPVRMRAVPTLTWYAADGQSGKYSTGSTVGGTDLTTEKSVGTSIDESETGIYHANFSEDVPAANLYAYHVVASAEL